MPWMDRVDGMTSARMDTFIAEMENPTMPAVINQQSLRLSNVIKKWEDKIAKGEIDDTEYNFSQVSLTRQNAQQFYSDK